MNLSRRFTEFSAHIQSVLSSARAIADRRAAARRDRRRMRARFVVETRPWRR